MSWVTGRRESLTVWKNTNQCRRKDAPAGPASSQRVCYCSLFKSHRADLQAKEKYLSAQCGKACKNKYCLDVHTVSHTGERQFHCKDCSKDFTVQGNLAIHERIHSGERPYLRPYLCSDFGKAFVCAECVAEDLPRPASCWTISGFTSGSGPLSALIVGEVSRATTS